MEIYRTNYITKSEQLKRFSGHLFPMIKIFQENVKNTIFYHTLAESATVAPGSKSRMWHFRPGYGKNRIRNTGINRASPEHMLATLTFGSGGNLYVLWSGHSLPP